MNKPALITGASSGIGYQLAELCAADKHDLILVARRIKELDELKEKLEKKYAIQIKTISKDLSLPSSPSEIHEILLEEGIVPEILINNAGFGDFSDFKNTDPTTNDNMIRVNVLALTQLTRFFIEDMIKNKKGGILNVASTASFQPGPLMSVYYASKSYVLSFSEALAEELKNTGISVTALCPGPTETEFQETAGMEKSKLFKRLSVMSPAKVAQIGYKGLKKGKRVVIPGSMNKMLTTSIRFTPRSIVSKIVKRMQESES
ncbi:MAG: SDR family NAD(P)-dependent oxidoreductase [Flavobacteriales bacterium]